MKIRTQNISTEERKFEIVKMYKDGKFEKYTVKRLYIENK